MKNINRKMISFILAIAMIISLIPSNLFIYAADESTMDIATDAPGESLPYGEVIATIRPNDEGKVRLYTGADIHASYSDVVWEESYPKTVKLVNYYEDSYVEGGYSFAVYLYQVETLDGEFWPYATNVWVYAPYLEDVTYTKTAEDEALIGKKLNVVGTVDEYGDLISTWHNDPLNEIYLDKFIYDWTEEDTSCVFTVTDVYRTPWGEWYRVTTDYTMMAEDFDDLWVSATDVKFIEAEEEDALIENLVDITMNGKEVTHLALSEGEKEYIFTDVNDALGKFVSYQWQILIDKETDSWANIYDYIYSYAAVSEALIKSCLDENDSATIRCIASRDGKKYVSDELVIFVEDDVATDAVDHSAEIKATENEVDYASGELFEYEIKYKYLHSSNINVVKGDPTLVTVLSPVNIPEANMPADGYTAISHSVEGYLPYREINAGEYDEENGCITYTTLTEDGSRKTLLLQPAPQETFTKGDPQSRDVYYVPQETTYTVSYFYQEVDTDSYYIGEQLVLSTEVHALVDQNLDVAKMGFDALVYNKSAVVKPNGTTHIGVYYDRLYFFIEFEGSTEYEGVTAYLVRYGTDITLPTPIKGNLRFDYWQLVQVTPYDINGKQETSITQASSNWTSVSAPYICSSSNNQITLLNHNLVYSPVWKDVSFTIRYYLENADDDSYALWHTAQVAIGVDATINANIYNNDSIITYYVNNGAPSLIAEQIGKIQPYLFVDPSLSGELLTGTKPDANGKTTIDIYYRRSEYTIRIFYARTVQSVYIFSTLHQLIENPSNATYSNQNWGQVKLSGGSSLASNTPPLDDPNFSAKEMVVSENLWYCSNKTNNCTYHYFDITAKYGATLTAWPSAGTFGYVELFNSERVYGGISAAWGGISNFEQKYPLVGVHTKMDESLIASPTTNVSNYVVKWITKPSNIAEITYESYLHTQDDSGNYYVNSEPYYKNTPSISVPIKVDSTNIPTTPSPIEGYVLPTGTNIDTNTSNVVKYFYQLGSYNVHFDNQYDPPTSQSLLYTQSLKNLTTPTVADIYPSTMPPDALAFAGWYDNAACTGTPINFSTTELVMPAHDITFYAKWLYKTFDVDVYFDGDKIGTANPMISYRDGDEDTERNNVEYNSFIQNPTNDMLKAVEKNENGAYSTYQEMTWMGWWYTEYIPDTETPGNYYTKEHRFDFDTMPIRQNHTATTYSSGTRYSAIYSKWSTEYPVEYVVQHVIKGTNTPIAAPEYGSTLHDREMVYKAKDSSEYYSQYVDAGYFPVQTQITKIVDATNPETYQIVFEYEHLGSVNYYVKHTFVSSDFTSILGSDTFTYTVGPLSCSATKVTEIYRTYIEAAGAQTTIRASLGKNVSDSEWNTIWNLILSSTPDAYEKELALSADPNDNVIEFTWLDTKNLTTYQIIHYREDLNGNYTIEEKESKSVALDPDTQTATVTLNNDYTAKTYTGFTFDDNKSDLSGVATKVSIGSGNAGLIIKLYYTRNEYTVTIFHSKKVISGEEIFSTQSLTKKYQETITETDNDLIMPSPPEGYYLEKTSFSATIFADTTLTLHYLPKSFTITYEVVDNIGGSISITSEEFSYDTTYPLGSIPTAASGYDFAGWYYDSKCESPVPSGWWSYGNNKLIPDKPTSNITYYAKFVPSVSDIFIYNSSLTDNDQAVIYTLRGTSGNSQSVEITFAVIGNQYVIIKNLPVGDYSVTVNDWSWRYETNSAEYSCNSISTMGLSFTHTVSDSANRAPTLVVDHNLANNQWLSDNAVNP